MTEGPDAAVRPRAACSVFAVLKDRSLYEVIVNRPRAGFDRGRRRLADL